MSQRDVLKRARARIADPDNWCRVAMARNAAGDRVPADDLTACRWCAFAAAELENATVPTILKLQRAASVVAGYDSIMILNDRTDHATVLRMFDVAIADCDE